jgi:hypothetical protein
LENKGRKEGAMCRTYINRKDAMNTKTSNEWEERKTKKKKKKHIGREKWRTKRNRE